MNKSRKPKRLLPTFSIERADLGTSYIKKIEGVRRQVIGQYGDDSPEYEADRGGKRTTSRAAGA